MEDTLTLSGWSRALRVVVLRRKLTGEMLLARKNENQGLRAFIEGDVPTARYEYAEWKSATANIDYHVEATFHYYSVPHNLVPFKFAVRSTATTIECFFTGKRVAAHVRSNSRGTHHTTLPEHMPESHRRHQDWSPGRLLNWGVSRSAPARATWSSGNCRTGQTQSRATAPVSDCSTWPSATARRVWKRLVAGP